MKETESRKEELLPAAFLLKNMAEMENLLKKGADPTKILPYHMAKMIQHEDFIIKMLNIEEIRNQNATTLVEMFVNDDAEKIKSFISFVKKHFYEATMDKKTRLWTRNVRPGFEKFVSKNDEELFYLRKLKSLGGRSIIQYVVDGGDNMMVLREQLLDSIVKIDRKMYHKDEEKEASQYRVIANVKRNIPSSRNLFICIESLETRYSWGIFTRIGHIAKSFASNIVLGYSLYLWDIGKDILYSYEIYGTKCNMTKLDGGNRTCLEDSVYLDQAIIGFAHIIVPFFVPLLVGVCCSVPWVSLPFPLITKGYRFYLDICHAKFMGIEGPSEDKQDEKLINKKEKVEFQRRKESYKSEKARNKEVQEKLKKNNRDILMAQQVECTGESSFQFFMQTLWLMPNLVVEQKEKTSLEDLFNFRIFSVVMSFITMGMSYTSIRFQKLKNKRGKKYFFFRNREKDGAMETKHTVLMMARIVLGKNHGAYV